MKICGIYKITSPSKKIYIGQSIDIMKRWSYYYGVHCKGQIFLYNSLKKFGVEKHKFEILCQCSREDLNNLEVYYIDLYQCFNSEFGMNLREGGNSYSISLETKRKISITTRGNKNHFFGKKHTKESLDKMSESQKNRSNEAKLKSGLKHKGKKLSDETKKKIGDGIRGEKNGMYGKTHSDETRKLLRDINLNPSKEKRLLLSNAHNHEKKAVVQIDKKNGELVKVWESIKGASEGLDLDASQIGQCCNNIKGYNTAGGFKWKFLTRA